MKFVAKLYNILINKNFRRYKNVTKKIGFVTRLQIADNVGVPCYKICNTLIGGYITVLGIVAVICYKAVVTVNLLVMNALQGLLQMLFLLLQFCNSVTCFLAMRYKVLLQNIRKVSENNLTESRVNLTGVLGIFGCYKAVVTGNLLVMNVLHGLLQMLFLLLQFCNSVTCFLAMRYRVLLQNIRKVSENNLMERRVNLTGVLGIFGCYKAVVTGNLLSLNVLQGLLQMLFLLLQFCNSVICFLAMCYRVLLQNIRKVIENNLTERR